MIQALLQDSGGGSSTTADQVVTGLSGCGGTNDGACGWVLRTTGNQTLADITDFLLNNVLTIVLILLVAFIALAVIKRVIRRAMNRLAKSAISIKEQAADDGLSAREKVELAQVSLRVKQRTDTLGVVLYAIARVFLWGIAGILVLGELGVNLGPLVAGAGVIGVALGFGSQKVVQDFLSGMFMIAEDQFGVGDVIDLGEARGTVEKITLRTTVLRDVYGTVWHVPNGEVQRVGNMSQRWSKALLDIGVAYDADLDEASEVLLRTATELAHEPGWAEAFLDDPEVLGVETLAADAVTIRIAVRTKPAKQWEVQRELNRRFKRSPGRGRHRDPLPAAHHLAPPRRLEPDGRSGDRFWPLTDAGHAVRRCRTTSVGSTT